MSRVTLSENAIRIPNPAVFSALVRLLAGGAVAGLIVSRLSTVERAYVRGQTYWGSSPIAVPPLDTLLSEWLPVGLVLMIVIAASIFSFLSISHGLMQLLRILLAGGTSSYAGAPGSIDRGAERAYELFTHRAISRQLPETPPLMARIILGGSAYWISPSSGALLVEWSQVTRRLLRWSIVLLLPAMLPAGWASSLVQRFEVSEAFQGVMEQIEIAVRWPLPIAFLAVITGIWGSYCLAALLIRGKQPRVHVVESHTASRTTGNPTDYYNFVMDRLFRLQHLNFPNRPIGTEQAPRIGTIRMGQGGDFSGVRTIETQPLPMGNGRSLPTLLLLIAGAGLMVSGFGILLWDPTFSIDRSVDSKWLPALATAVIAIVGGRGLFRAGGRLAHTFRFHSDLVRIEVKGTYTADRLGAGDGRGGLLFAESMAVQSHCHVTLHASRIITEVVPPASSWSPVAEAMQTPRFIIDTTAAADFTERMDSLLGSLDAYETQVRLATVDTQQGGLRELVSINQAITEASVRLQGPAEIRLSHHADALTTREVAS